MATLLDILVLPLAPTVVNGATRQMQAIGIYDDETEADITTTVDWTSGTLAHATVGLNTGLVTGVATGTSLITATSGIIVGSQTITSGIGSLVSIAVTSVSQSDIKGGTEQYTATGTYQDTSTADLTTTVDWTSSVPGVATVGLHTGLATAVAIGDTVLTATLGAISNHLGYNVHNLLVSIAVTPGTPSKAKGLTQQFVATGTYEDASEVVITTSSSWLSATPAHVTVGAATGLATAVGVGTSVIGATVGAIEGHATMTVVAATLVTVVVTPALPSILNGATVQLTATGTYTDATVVDITTTSDWLSATPSHATVGLHTGLVTGIATGTAVVGATLATVEGHTTVTSGTGYLVSLAITPAAPTVLATQTQQFVATGTYQDASTADLTTTVAWVSSVTTVGTVGAATGLFTAVAGGDSANTTVSVVLGGVNASTQVHVSALIYNFYSATDIQDAATWTAVPFGFLADSIALANISGVEVQFSFDGVRQHGVLDAATDASGKAAVHSYGSLWRSSVWLKRTTGTGGGAKVVRVEALTKSLYGEDRS
jgi:hypothetical protein